MSSAWSYAPITIHLERHETEQVALSGVYLLNTYTHNYYFITLGDISKPETYRYKFTSPQFISTTTINWVPLVLSDVKLFKDESSKSSSLAVFINGLMGNDQFRFKPHSFRDLGVLVLRLPSNFSHQSFELFPRNALQELHLLDANQVQIPTKVKIQCCPFSLTNAALFSKYQMFGSVNYKIRDSGFLSDIKYLDDVIGGLVNLDGTHDGDKSLGLVCGYLSKVNGDGDLMTIVSWNKIIQFLAYHDLVITSTNTTDISSVQTIGSQKLMSEAVNRPYDPIDSTVRISVRSNKGSFWGSGIILTNEYIITNLHVLQLDTLRDLKISIPSLPHVSIELKHVTPITCPIIGFDLCFLKLKTRSFALTPVVSSNIFLDPLHIGMPVKTTGYGLFHSEDKSTLKPFHSEGFINNIVNLDLDENGIETQSLLLVSASCWNGSSGGGLFNERNQLIGIMTSNGKLSSGEILPQFTLVIPINIIEKALFMILNDIEPIEVEKQIQDVWSLTNTHKHLTVNYIPNKL